MYLKNLIELRKRKGWTQEKLAREADISYHTLIKLERNGIKNPKIETVIKLADALMALYEPLLDNKTNQDSKALKRDHFVVKALGDNKDAAMDQITKLLKENAPAGLGTHLDTLDSKSLAIMTMAVHKIASSYMGEDSLPTGGGAPAGNDIEANRAKGRELMASEAWMNPTHKDHNAVKEQVGRLYGTWQG